MDTPTNTTCQVCQTQFSRYTCPRCGTSYCSVVCYRAHNNGDCAQGLAKNNLNELLLSEKPVSSQEIGNMAKILKRVHQADSDDADPDAVLDDEDLQRLAELDISYEDLLDELTPEERSDFERVIQHGDDADLEALGIRAWSPWWRDKSCLITEVSPDDSTPKETPPLLQHVPSFDSITQVPPSPALIAHVSQILYGYAFVMRRVNGEWLEHEDLVVEVLLGLCDALLGSPTVPQAPATAVNAALQKAVQGGWGSRDFAVLVIADIECILALGSTGIQLVVSHIYHIFSRVLGNPIATATTNTNNTPSTSSTINTTNAATSKVDDINSTTNQSTTQNQITSLKKPQSLNKTKLSRGTALRVTKKMEYFFAWAKTVDQMMWQITAETMTALRLELLPSALSVSG
eukprot:c10308_g1_i1.p1 GENE.c10308_g1_i1~~c10308_g1_i1.p1  ORF type:complete len:421 (+),score=115.74 c10308_g1_i1:57-1265(+)